jgi:hypothetical protein
VLIFSIISLVWHWQYIVAVSHTYDHLRSQYERKRLRNSLYEDLGRRTDKMQRKNKDYKRQLSGGGGLNKSGNLNDVSINDDRNFAERSGIGKNPS